MILDTMIIARMLGSSMVTLNSIKECTMVIARMLGTNMVTLNSIKEWTLECTINNILYPRFETLSLELSCLGDTKYKNSQNLPES